MYTQRIHQSSSITFKSHNGSWSQLIRPRKQILGKQIRPNFFAFGKLLYKMLLTNLVACKPAFYTFYTHHIWGENSAMRRCFHHTDLGLNVVFLNFEIRIALIQYSGRLKRAWAFSETAKKISKITYTACRVWYGRHFEYSCKRCSWTTENKRHSDENCKRDYW